MNPDTTPQQWILGGVALCVDIVLDSEIIKGRGQVR